MALLSIEFFVFLLATAAVYYLCPIKCRFAVLFAASTYYYIVTAGRDAALVFLGYLLIFVAGAALLGRIREGHWLRRVIYWFCILLSVGGLLFFNYINPLKLATPLGMSFWMVIGIGFLTDVYWGTVKEKTGIFKPALLLGFFPLMTSGPIVRYKETAQDICGGHKFDYERVTFGIQRIVWGCFKKLVISERLAVIVNTVYGDYNAYPGFYIILAMCCFSLQLYTDFSGCMDIVLGAADVFGITLPENFETPFFSKNVSEFWRRWHITLGIWLKEYVLYPVLHSGIFRKFKKACKKALGKKWGERIPLYTGMFISWFLIGYWHGGTWNYIFGVGLWFWFVIVSGEILTPLFHKLAQVLRVNRECFSYKLFQCLRTFAIVSVGLAFFRAPGAKEGVRILMAVGKEWNPYVLFGQNILTLGLDLPDFIVTIAGCLALLVVSILQYRGGSVRKQLAKQNLVFRWAVYLVLFFAVIIWGKYGAQYNAADFIYQGF